MPAEQKPTSNLTVTVYYKDVEINLSLFAADIDSVKELAEYYLENGFTAKRAFVKQEKTDWVNRVVVVDSVTPVEGKKYFDVNFHDRTEPEDKGKIITFEKNSYRKGDVIILFRNDKGFLTGELYKDPQLSEEPPF